MRILFCSFDSPGMLFPLIGVASEMRARGHSISFVTGEAGLSYLARIGMDRIPRGVKDGPSFEISVWSKPLNVAMDVKHIEYAIRQFQPDMLVTHALCLGPLICKERIGVPVAVVGLMSYLWPLCAGMPGSASADTTTTREWRLGDMLGHYNACRATFGLAPLTAAPDDNPFLGDLYMVRSVSDVEPDVDLLPNRVRLIGAATWDPPEPTLPHETRAWDEIAELLHSGRPLIYVHIGRTFGKPGFWAPLIAALDGTGIGVVASVGRADRDLGDVPPNFVVHRHAPQGFVIPHCRLVVSGGYTTPTLGALTYGRPTLVFPAGGETRDNAERIERARCGRSLLASDASASAIRDLVFRVLADQELAEHNVAVQAAFGEVPSFRVAATLLESMHANGVPAVTDTERPCLGLPNTPALRYSRA